MFSAISTGVESVREKPNPGFIKYAAFYADAISALALLAIGLSVATGALAWGPVVAYTFIGVGVAGSCTAVCLLAIQIHRQAKYSE